MHTNIARIQTRASDAGNQIVPKELDIYPSFPRNEEDIVSSVNEASNKNRPICVSAALTGLAGAGVPLYPKTGSLTRIFMDKLITVANRPGFQKNLSNGILISDDGNSCILAPGVRIAELRSILEKNNLMYLPHPEYTQSMIAGNVATNASGPRSFGVGPTRDHVRSLRVVLADGDIVTIRRGDIRAFDGQFNVEIGGKNPHQLNFSVPTYPCPSIKNAAGLIVSPEMDLIDLFIGSEGSFGIFSEIEVCVFPLRKIESKTLLLNNEEAALELASELREHRMSKEKFMQDPLDNDLGVLAVEFFDSYALALARQAPQLKISDDARAAIQLQLFTDDNETSQTTHNLLQKYEKYYVGIIPGEQASIFRTSTPGIVAESLKRLGLTKIGTDFAVAPSNFSALFDVYRFIRGECNKHFTTPAPLPTSAIWGHIGDCNLHMNLFPNTAEELQLAEELYGIAVEEVIKLGGTVSAEHGTGKKSVYAFGQKKHYLEHMLGPKAIGEIAAVKKVFDPKDILNPGNLAFLSDDA
jgi:D-lactate dehydrogenase (cytochrome)